MILNSKIQDLISVLLSSTRGVEADQFQAGVMAALDRIIPFDKALWASGYVRGLVVHNSYLHNLPDALMASWERIKDQDRLLAGLIRDPGKTMDVYDFYSRQEREIQDTYRKHSLIFGIEHAISTACPSRDTGLLEIMSLYRSDAGSGFTPEERNLKEFLFPLVVEAWHNNQLYHLMSRGTGPWNGAVAVCDSRGWIRQTEKGFVNLIREAWPDWSGPALPPELAGMIASGDPATRYFGPVRFAMEKISSLFLVKAHQPAGTELLTSRESQVAQRFASGQTYREIADALHISPATVRNHITSVYRKLQVTSKLELWQLFSES